MTNREVAAALLELADLAELRDEPDTTYRVRALRAGARAIERLTEPVGDLLARRALDLVTGIGEGIVRRVDELLRTGRLAELDAERAAAGGLVAVARITGIGPTTARALRDRLGVHNLDDFEAALLSGRLAAFPSLKGRRSDELLQAIDAARRPPHKVRRELAEKEAAPYGEMLAALPSVAQFSFCGSIRRKHELIGDVDYLVGTDDYKRVGEAAAAHPRTEHVYSRGGRTSVVTWSGMQVDFFCVPPGDFGWGLHAFSGAKEHVIAVRMHGLKLGYKITEHGVWTDAGAGDRLPGGSEEADLFRALDMQYVVPELRENRGEVERAIAWTLPVILEEGDVVGDLHVHSSAGDGRASLEEISAAAAARGLGYVAIADHFRLLGEAGVRDAIRRVRAENERTGGRPRLLAGAEVDILPDGRLDAPAALLHQLDWVIGAAHEALDQPRAQLTARLVSAIESGAIDALGHPTGRIVGIRDALDIDLPELVAAAARSDVALELNAHPDRLDLGDVHAFMARERGAWLCIGSDAHDAAAVGRVLGAVYIARRAWVEKTHVLNTRPVAELLDLVAARRREAGL
ncbi:MAG TPA: PHP domain-containing protein [Haliangiales bacterium]|nr:PHP domain-containing protein [Haliangiales bacterium]